MERQKVGICLQFSNPNQSGGRGERGVWSGFGEGGFAATPSSLPAAATTSAMLSVCRLCTTGSGDVAWWIEPTDVASPHNHLRDPVYTFRPTTNTASRPMAGVVPIPIPLPPCRSDMKPSAVRVRRLLPIPSDLVSPWSLRVQPQRAHPSGVLQRTHPSSSPFNQQRVQPVLDVPALYFSSLPPVADSVRRVCRTTLPSCVPTPEPSPPALATLFLSLSPECICQRVKQIGRRLTNTQLSLVRRPPLSVLRPPSGRSAAGYAPMYSSDTSRTVLCTASSAHTRNSETPGNGDNVNCL